MSRRQDDWWTPTMRAALIALAGGPLVATRRGFVPAMERMAAPPFPQRTITVLTRRRAVVLGRPNNVKGNPLTARLTKTGRFHAARFLAERVVGGRGGAAPANSIAEGTP